jgi:tRNA(Arg) A34 adenosine deaminase TadA
MKNNITQKDVENFNRLLKLLNNQYKFFVRNNKKKIFLMGALLIHKNKFTFGFNNYNKTHTNTIQLNKTFLIPIHAEIEALNKWNLNWNIHKSTLYVAGLGQGGTFCKSSRPCNSCLEKIKQKRVKKVVYAIFNNGELKLSCLNE